MHLCSRALHLGCALLGAAIATLPTARACDRCQPSTPAPHATHVDTAALLKDLDRRAQAASSAQPRFAFPARIGVARIEHGAITPIPGDEWTEWRGLRERMTPALGELTPVTALVAQSLTTAPVSRTPHDAITNLRLAAAREQLDAILLYEVTTAHSLEQTELTLLDATIVGAWLFPTHKSRFTAHASATLIDVRSGLAYGSVIGNAEDVCSATLLGSEDKIVRQRDATVRKSVAALAPEIGALMTRLAGSPQRSGARATEHVTWSPHAARTPETSPSPADGDTIIPPPAESGDSFWGSR